MYLVSLHGHLTSAVPSGRGKPTECRPLTKPASCCSMARSTGVPMRAMIFIDTTT